MARSSKEGYVRIRERLPGSWQAAFTDPATGRRERITIRATSTADARRQAKALSDQIAARRFGTKRGNEPTIGQAMQSAIEASRGNLETRKWYTRWANKFLEWLAEAHPTVKHWTDLKTEMVRAYLAYCERELGLSCKSIRARMLPIHMAARLMVENDPERYPRDVARPVRTPASKGNPLEQAEREARKALPAAALRVLLDALRERWPRVYAIAALQALAGLRVLEALALRECDVNAAEGVVTVTKTARHTPKNAFSYRKVPVLPEVTAALRDVIAGLPVGNREREIFLTRLGTPFTRRGYHDSLTEAMRPLWRETGIEAFRDFQPHWLRATFASGASAGGANERSLKVYLGHSRGDVLGLHYEQINLDRLRADVLTPLAKWWHNSDTTAIPSERKVCEIKP